MLYHAAFCQHEACCTSSLLRLQLVVSVTTVGSSLLLLRVTQLVHCTQSHSSHRHSTLHINLLCVDPPLPPLPHPSTEQLALSVRFSVLLVLCWSASPSLVALMSALSSPKVAQASTPKAITADAKSARDDTTHSSPLWLLVPAVVLADRVGVSLSACVLVCWCVSVPSPSAAVASSGASLPSSPSKSSKRAVEADRRKADQMSAEVVRAQSLASARWSDCLLCPVVLSASTAGQPVPPHTAAALPVRLP